MNKKGFLFSFLFVLFSFCFISKISALSVDYYNIRINDMMINNIWSQLEGKTASQFPNTNSSDSVHLWYRTDYPLLSITKKRSNNNLLYLTFIHDINGGCSTVPHTNEYKNWDSYGRYSCNSWWNPELNGYGFYSWVTVIYNISTNSIQGYNFPTGNSNNEIWNDYNSKSFAQFEISITSFDITTGNNVNITKYFDYNSNPITRTYHFHLNGGNAYDFRPGYEFGTDEDFSLSLYDSELQDTIENLTMVKSHYIFSGWYYDSNLTLPFSINDSLTDDEYDLYAKWEFDTPSYLDGYRRVDLSSSDKYIMISYITSGSVFVPTSAFNNYGGRLSYYDSDLDSQPYSSYIQDYTEMSDGLFVRQDFDLNNYDGADWVMFSKYIYLEGEDNISYSIYIPDNSYDSDVSITPNNLGGNNFDFTYKDENGDVQNGQVISQEGSSISLNIDSSLSNSFNYFTNPIKFIIRTISNLYNNYLSSSLKHYFFILFTLVIVILLTRVIF